MSRTSKALLRLGVPGLAAVTLVAGIPAFLGTAQAAPIGSLSITPVDGNDSAAAGSCQAYFVTATPATANTSTVGETVNVILTDIAGSASSDVSFCTAPTTVGGNTFTPQAGTVVTAGGAQTGGGSVDQSRFTLGAGTTAAANNGRIVIGLTRNLPGTGITIQAYSDRNGNNAFNAGEPTDSRTTTFTAGGPADSNPNQDAVTNVEVVDGGEPATATNTAGDDTDRALVGEARSFTVATNNGTDPNAGVRVSYFITSSVAGNNVGTTDFGVTNNDGIVTGTITRPGRGDGHDHLLREPDRRPHREHVHPEPGHRRAARHRHGHRPVQRCRSRTAACRLTALDDNELDPEPQRLRQGRRQLRRRHQPRPPRRRQRHAQRHRRDQLDRRHAARLHGDRRQRRRDRHRRHGAADQRTASPTSARRVDNTARRRQQQPGQLLRRLVNDPTPVSGQVLTVTGTSVAPPLRTPPPCASAVSRPTPASSRSRRTPARP